MKSVRNIKNLENTTVLLRTSLNAPVENGKVTDTFRLLSALATIEYLQSRNARVVLISHITGTGTETLHPMYEALKEKISRLSFCEYSIGPIARETVRRMVAGEVVMLENLRRHKGEEGNDPAFARELATMADVFVQDSFDVCHRAHASVVGLPELLPSYAGLTVEREVKELSKARKPKHPALAIIGGAKLSTKEPLLKQLLKTYDHVFVAGALANDFIKAKGYDVGHSLVSSAGQENIQQLLSHKRLIVPVDAIVAPFGKNRDVARVTGLKDIKENEAIYDVGPHTSAALMELALKAKTILWSGPLGLFERGFMDGTRVLAHAVAGHTHSIVGGGDTISALDELDATKEFSFVSTGGGAMLDFLADGTLVGLEALR
jgi:phosphoglycerate kinase